MNKRIRFVFISLLALVLQVSAEDKVTIKGFSILAGETKTLSIELENEVSYAGFQFDLYLPEGITVTKWSKDENRIPESTTLSFSEQKDGSFRFMAVPSFDLEEIKGNSGNIISIEVSADKELKDGKRTGYFRKVMLSDVLGKGPTYDMMSFIIIVGYVKGDTNSDGIINAADIVEVANYIMGNASYTFNKFAADANVDDVVNVADIVAIANIIMGTK